MGIEPARWGWLNRDAARRKTLEVLESFHHPEIHPDRPVAELPLAARQVVEICRALAARANIILMDEPSEGLSPLMVEKTAEAILMLRSRGLSVLLVEQQVGYALRISQRTSILEDGIIVHEASSEEVASNEMLLHRHLGTALTA